MTALDLLTLLDALGIVLKVEDGHLLYRPRRAMTARLQAALEDRKDEIRNLLTWPVEAARYREEDLKPLLLHLGAEVSTPRGSGQLVAVLPEYVMVRLSNPRREYTSFLPCEVRLSPRPATVGERSRNRLAPDRGGRLRGGESGI